MEIAKKPALRHTSTLRAWAGIVADYATWLLALAVAASIATEQALPLALAVAVLQLIARTIAYARPITRTLADWPILGLAIMALLSLAVTARMDLTGPQVGRLLLGIALYYAVVSWAHNLSRLQLVHLGFIGVGIVLAMGAMVGVDWTGRQKLFFVPTELTNRLTRLTTESINPNVLAGYLALLLPISLGPALFAWRQLGRMTQVVLIIGLLIMSPILLLTQSRAGVMAAGVGLVALGALRWRWGLIVVLILSGGGVLAFALGYQQVILEFLGSNVSLGGMAERQEIWSRAWFMIQDFFFTGIGMGSFAFVTDLLYPLFLSPPGVEHAHNLFLQVAVDLGVPGLLAYVATLTLVVVMAWRARQGLVEVDASMVGLAAGLLAAQVALVAHGMLDAVTWGMVRPSVMIWAIWGTAAALWRLRQ